MELDEDALTRFFGSPPLPMGEEERAFFGALAYEIQEGTLTLHVSFSTNFGDVRFHITAEGRDEPLLQSSLTEIRAVTVVEDPDVLTITGRGRDSAAADDEPVLRAVVTLDPLAVRLEDGDV